MGIEEVAAELYALAPEEFTAARNARAKEAKASGDHDLAAAVRALRKPTAGAWLLDALVREHREEVGQVLELGERLRAAQGTLGGAELRALDEQRRRLTRAVAQQAVDLGRGAGRTVSSAVRAAVEETLRSAMVDPDAGAALATGLLVDTFSSTGLEPVDLERVVAVPGLVSGGGVPRPVGESGGDAAAERDERAVARARSAVEEAEEALRTATEAAEEARREAGRTGRRREDLRSEAEEARRRLEDLDQRLEAASDAADDARRAQLVASRRERSAAEAAERAARRLERLLGDRS